MITRDMSIFDLIKQLGDKKIKLWLEEGELKFKAPKGALTAELKQKLIASKTEIIAFLAEQQALAESSPISGREDKAQLPLSFAQQRLWFIEQFDSETDVKGKYNIPVALSLKGNLDIKALENAVNQLVKRHEVLQCYFVNEQGSPIQKKTENPKLNLHPEDISQLSAAEQELLIDQTIEENISSAFPLDKWPLFNIQLLKKNKQEEEGDFILLATMHHIISDAWSMGVLITEIAHHYSQQENDALPALEFQYADYAFWQKHHLDQELQARQQEYWQDNLRNLPVLELPQDKVRGLEGSSSGKHAFFKLNKEISESSQRIAKELGVTQFTLLLTVFSILLQRYSRQNDFAIGIPIANRQHQEWESLIGFFVNSLSIRIDASENPSVEEFIQRIHKTTLNAYENQDLPFDKVIDAVVSDRDPSRTPLFQVMFSLQNTPTKQSIQLPEIEISSIPYYADTARYDMTWNLREDEDGIEGHIEYNADIFLEISIQQYIQYFKHILEELSVDYQRSISSIPLQNLEECQISLDVLNDAFRSYPDQSNLLQLFDETAEKYANNIAIAYKDKRLDYKEVKIRVDALAAKLLSANVQIEDKVIIAMERSIDMTIAILATLKVGAAYVPLDPDYPEERRKYIIEDSQAKLFVSNKTYNYALEDIVDSKNILLIEAVGEAPLNGVGDRELSQRRDQIDVMSIAAIFYTSGTTGQPKGVCVPHKAIVRLVKNTNYADFNEHSSVAHLSNVCFDAASMEIWGALLNGGQLSIIDKETLLNIKNFSSELKQKRIDIMFMTSGLYKVYAQENPSMFSGLKTLLTGGEQFDLATAALVLESGGPPEQLINVYGSTENGTYSTIYVVKEIQEDQTCMPVGKPIANTGICLIDDNLNVQAPGLIGELVCLGDGLCLGYLNKPEMTAQSFTDAPKPFFDNQKMYRTGDLARIRFDGEIEIVGRIDEQVKIRGHRIEPLEVETILQEFDSVQTCTVVVKNNQLDQKCLVAYVVLVEDENIKDKNHQAEHCELMLEQLADKLPAYLMPATIMAIDELPLNSSGKTDKRLLPEPNWENLGTRDFEPPLVGLESQIAKIWQALLSLDQIGRHDNFFNIGGHSLIATQLISRLEDQLGVTISLRQLFEKASIAELAAIVREQKSYSQVNDIKPISKVSRDQTLYLSNAQRRLWFIHKLDPESHAYGMPMAISIKGKLEVQKLEESFKQLVQRHESLRTTFVEQNDEPILKIHSELRWELEKADINSDAELQKAIKENIQSAFNIEKGPLFRAKLLTQKTQTGDPHYILLLNMHHIISDGWSMGILQRDLLSLYWQMDLPDLEIQYADFAQWQHEYLQGERLNRLLDYWKENLKNAPEVLRLPTDKPRPKVQSYQGAVVARSLSPENYRQLKDFCKQHKVTPFMLLMACYQIVLAKYSGQEDICVGIPVAGRNNQSLESLIGFFVNAVVIRGIQNQRYTLQEFVEEIKQTSLAAFAHQDLSADILLEALDIKRSQSHAPLAQVGFSYGASAKSSLVSPDPSVSFEIIEQETQVAKYDILLNAADSNAGLDLSCEYNTDLFNASTMEAFLSYLELSLQIVCSRPGLRLDQLHWQTPGEIKAKIEQETDKTYEQVYPLSGNQKALYLDALINQGTLQNSIGNLAFLNIPIDESLWRQAIAEVDSQHSVLRTEITNYNFLGESEPYQCILPATDKKLGARFHFQDLQSKDLGATEFKKFVANIIYQPYNLEEQEDLIQYYLFKLGNENYVAMVRAHHIIFDGISGKIILEQQLGAYETKLQDGNYTAEQDNFQGYIEETLAFEDSKQTLDHWRTRLKTVHALSFDKNEKAPQEKSNRLSESLNLTEDQSHAIKLFCRQHRITPAIYFKALYTLIIAQYCRPESDFHLLEYSHGRSGAHLRKGGYFNELGLYYQQTPFCVPNHLINNADNTLFDFFNYIKQYQKDIKAFRELSVQAQTSMLPQSALSFMYNYTQFESTLSLMGEPIDTLFYSPLAENAVQLFIREHARHFEYLLLFDEKDFASKGMLPRLAKLSEDIQKRISAPEALAFPLRNIDFLLNEDKESLDQFNCASHSEVPSDNVLRPFLEIATKHADLPAVVSGDQEFSYKALDAKSNDIAQYILDLGLSNSSSNFQERVIICLPQGFDQVASLYGVIKAGLTYIPVESQYPQSRIDYILEDSQAKVVITHQALAHLFDNSRAQVLFYEDLNSHAIENKIPIAAHEVNEGNSLYVIYTSGSTGEPKGAELNHRGENNLLNWYQNTFEFNSDDSAIIISAFGFDLSQKNYFALLRCGGKIVFPEMEVFDPRIIRETILKHQISIINCAPSAFYALLDCEDNEQEKVWQALSSLRWVILGGEKIHIAELRAWLDNPLCKAKLVNSYGPTECTDVVSYKIMSPGDGVSLSLGVPINNTQIYVLDEQKRQVPPGIVGDIAIAGAGLGLGYIGKKDLTRKSFIANPFAEGKLYLSGDLGYINCNNELETIGRKDFQVKIRGQRLELGEIEAVINKLEGVRDCVLVLMELAGQESLVAYVRTQLGNELDLQDQLRAQLPAYMLPSAYVYLKDWPLNPNGKIDRDSLPEPQTRSQRPFVAPSNEIEIALAEIWCDVLSLDEVSIHDSFFELGGHSLLATKAVSRLKTRFQVEIPLKALFDMHTIAEIAAYIKTLQWALDSKAQKDNKEDGRVEGTI